MYIFQSTNKNVIKSFISEWKKKKEEEEKKNNKSLYKITMHVNK